MPGKKVYLKYGRVIGNFIKNIKPGSKKYYQGRNEHS